jgi:DivIVA domain-containing protein
VESTREDVSVQEDSIKRIRSATFSIARKGYDKREVEQFLSNLADWLEAGGGDQARSDVVRRELERVGEKTGAILAAAHEAAEKIRLEAGQEVAGAIEESRREEERIRSRADEYHSQTRGEAERQAEETRQEADLYSGKTREDADRHAAGAVAEADRYSTRTRAEADEYAERLRGEAERDAAQKRSAGEHQARQTIQAAKKKTDQIVEEGNRRRSDIETVISDLASHRDAVLAEMRRLTGELSSTVGSHAPEPEPPSEAEDAGALASPAEEAQAEDTPVASGSERGGRGGTRGGRASPSEGPKRGRKPASG